jgi:hypothetical protein
MPKSPSSRALLVNELRQLVIRYREHAPSTLLAELELFLDSQGIGLGQHRRDIEKQKKKKKTYASFDTKWKRLGFDSKADLEAFENRSDFPGWDAL